MWGSLPSQSASKKHKKAHKPLRNSWISQKLCLPCLIIIQYCYCDCRISKPCSHCVMCVSCSGSWSRRSTHAKDHRLFQLNYPQINEVGNPITCIAKLWNHESPKRSFPVLTWKSFAKSKYLNLTLKNLLCYFFYVRDPFSVMFKFVKRGDTTCCTFAREPMSNEEKITTY